MSRSDPPTHDDFDRVSDLLNEGDIPLRCIRIVEYLTEDGDVGTYWQVSDDATIREVVAMLAIAHAHVIAPVVPDSE